MLHPETRAALQLLEDQKAPALRTSTAQEVRDAARQRWHLTQPSPPPVGDVSVSVIKGPGGPLRLRHYRPLDSAAHDILPVLMYFHGGGFMIGNLDSHDTLCRELANGANCAVVAVDYRLAPEHPYPAAPEDCLAATYWVAAHAAALRVDARRLAVGGDSAGANLATVVALQARDAGDLPIAFQLLIYPCVDGTFQHASYQENAEGYLLTSDAVEFYYQSYLADPAQAQMPTVSPLLHPDLSRLPPTLVLTAGYDPLRDEGMAYADRLSMAGTPTTLVHFPRQIHGFILMGRLLDEAHDAVGLCTAALKRALSVR